MTSLVLSADIQRRLAHITTAANSETAAHISRITRKAQATARTEKRRREEQRRERNKRAARLATIIEGSIQGLQTLLSLVETPAMAKMLAARSAAGSRYKSEPGFVLYHGVVDCDDELLAGVAVSLFTRGVTLDISADRASPCQTSGGLTRYARCTTERSFLTNNREIPEEWLDTVFHDDFAAWWDSYDYDEIPHERPVGPTNYFNGRSSDGLFAAFDALDPWAVMNHREEEYYELVQPGVLLMKFLSECQDPSKLEKYLTAALAAMR